MLHIQVSQPSPEPSAAPSLADLSRNASVISSSSSSSSTSVVLNSPPRPRPIRTFSSPRSRSRDASVTPRSPRAPAYLAKELGLAEAEGNSYDDLRRRAQSRSKSRPKSRASSVGRIKADDFVFGEILGEGSYSTVVHAVYIATEQEYAIKILDKGHLAKVQKMQTALAEKNTLVRLGSGHPGIVRLHWTFQDEWSLYFVLDLAKNGELQSRISRLGSLSLNCVRYYSAQIVDAVAYMHSKGVIHRDLKPENLLLDDNMRLKITDFGTGKILDDGSERAGTFVGTAQYVSPELLMANSTTKASDVWAIGCIMYQMIAGRFPFHALSEYLMWQKVKSLDYTFPEGFDPIAKDLVQKLLVLDPSKRLGAGDPGSPNDMSALRAHPFFESISWSTLWSDPAPTMECGLVKKEAPVAGQNYDVGFAWEQLVGADEDGDVPWVDNDGEFAPNSAASAPYAGYPFTGSGGEIGPHDIPPMATLTPEAAAVESMGVGGRFGIPTGFPVLGAENESANATLVDPVVQASMPVNIQKRDSVAHDTLLSTSSSTSSSEGSPVRQLGETVDAMALADELERGRDRATTPIQLINSSDAQWAELLQPGEELIFHAPVELKSRTRRLTATLLPIPATQNRPKLRHLVLTSRRLICTKLRHNHQLSVKGEALLRAMHSGKEGKEDKRDRDTRPIITGVMAKGQKAFIVTTSGKPQQYATEPLMVQRWVSELQKVVKHDDPAPKPTAQPSISSFTSLIGGHTRT